MKELGWAATLLVTLVAAAPIRGEEALKPTEVLVLDDFPTEEMLDGRNIVSYYVLGKLQTLRFRMQGPGWMKLLLRGTDTGEISYVLGLDGIVSGAMKIIVTPYSPRAVFCKIPPGKHEISLVPMDAIMARAVMAKRGPVESEPEVTFNIFAKRPRKPPAPAREPRPTPAVGKKKKTVVERSPARLRPAGRRRTKPDVNWATQPHPTRPAREFPPSGFVVGLHGAAFLPVGAWTDHILAGQNTGGINHPDDLEQVGPGGGGILELGYKWESRVSMILQVDVTSLWMEEWEDYANKVGSDISVWGMQWDINLMISGDLLAIKPFRLELRGGIGYMHAWGEEQNNDYDLSYSYSFLGPAFSVRAGLSGGYMLSRGIELVLMADCSTGWPGVQHIQADYSNPFVGFTLSIGVRFWTHLLGSHRP